MRARTSTVLSSLLSFALVADAGPFIPASLGFVFATPLSSTPSPSSPTPSSSIPSSSTDDVSAPAVSTPFTASLIVSAAAAAPPPSSPTSIEPPLAQAELADDDWSPVPTVADANQDPYAGPVNPLITPPPGQDADLAEMGFYQTTYYSCNTFAETVHCGWHVPLIRVQAAGWKALAGTEAAAAWAAGAAGAAVIIMLA